MAGDGKSALFTARERRKTEKLVGKSENFMKNFGWKRKKTSKKQPESGELPKIWQEGGAKHPLKPPINAYFVVFDPLMIFLIRFNKEQPH